MSNPLKLGIIGAGEITRHILQIVPRYNITPIAITDLNTEAASTLADTVKGLQAVPISEALLALPEVEAVYVATPPASHLSIYRQVIKGRKHLIGEKPWAFNAEEAMSLHVLAEKYPELVVASCASRCRFNPAVDALQSMIGSGILGRLRFIHIRSQIAPPLPLAQLPKWKTTPSATPGGVSADWSVYELEWLRGTLQEDFDPIDVHAVFDFWNREGTPFESSYQFTIRCRNGLTILITRTCQVGPIESLVQVRGEKGGADLPFTPHASIDCLRQYSLGADGQLITNTVEGTECNWEENVIGPLVDAHQAIRDKRPPMADAASQVLLHQVLDAAYASAREGKIAEINRDVEAASASNSL